MTISITASSASYTGDGSTTTFDVKSGSNGIYFAASSELTVTVDGVTKSLGTHYTVAGAGTAAGTITFLTAPAADTAIVIERNTPKTQTLDLSSAGAFNPDSIEGALDKLTRVAQDLSRELPSFPVPEAGQYLGWNDAGTALENKDGAGVTFEVGTVTTGAAGTSVEVEIDPSSTATNIVLNFTIPRGETGVSGSGSGDVIGPASAVDDRVATFNGTTGKLIQDGGKTIAEIEAAAAASAVSTIRNSVDAAYDTLSEIKTALDGKQASGTYYSAGGTDVPVADGGTGASSFTAYAVVCGGTSNTNPLQPIASVGNSGDVLTSNGAGALPTFQTSTVPTAASQANQETATSTTTYVSPGRQHYHPSAAKAWVKFNTSGTILASYNITSITDNGAGDWTVNIATDFSSANYCGVAFGGPKTGPVGLIYNLGTGAGAGTFQILANDTSGTPSDPSVQEIYAVFFGDQ